MHSQTQIDNLFISSGVLVGRGKHTLSPLGQAAGRKGQEQLESHGRELKLLSKGRTLPVSLQGRPETPFRPAD